MKITLTMDLALAAEVLTALSSAAVVAKIQSDMIGPEYPAHLAAAEKARVLADKFAKLYDDAPVDMEAA